MEQSLAIIKPDAVKRKQVGEIISEIEKGDFKIERIKIQKLSYDEAARFYEVHKDKSFYRDLIVFMSSGPIFVMVLGKEDALQGWRTLMGHTDPLQAAEGTIRKRLGTSIQENCVHGSDSPENAKREINFFFGDGR